MAADSREVADLVLLGAKVITNWRVLPRAEAIAVRNGSILAVGCDREIATMAGRHTDVVHCHGRSVTPGFHDAHIHLLACANRRLSVDCSPAAVRSIHMLQQVIRERAQSVPPGNWIRAGDYDEFYLAERRHPTRWDLDAAAPDHPVKLQHRSHHACVFNTAALHLLGIHTGNSSHHSQVVERDPLTREPTGLVYEYSSGAAEDVVPPVDEGDLRIALDQVLQELLIHGITSVQDASYRNGLPEWNRFREVRSEDTLRPRIRFMVGMPHLGDFVERGMGPGFGDERLSVGGVKIMLTETGESFHPSPETLFEQVWQAHRNGYQVSIHAVEESTICVAIEALAAAMSRHQGQSHRIEHCSVLPPPLLDRLSELRIGVTTNPGFLYHSGDRYLEEVEPHVRGWLYPIRSLLNKRVTVAAGSDAPVSSQNPLEGVYAAVTRLSRAGQVVGEAEKVTVEEALSLYTLGAAMVGLQEHRMGSIEPGKLADLVVLSTDLTAVDPGDIKDVEVDTTIIGGKVAFWRR